jgi:hypothetical protein
MSDTLGIINYQVLNVLGQPLANVEIAILAGDLGTVVTSTQPGSPLAVLFADPGKVTAITNPTTPGTATVTTDGLGNLCTLVNGVYTIGVCVGSSGYGSPPEYVVLQIFGAGVAQQQLVQLFVPHP